MPKKSPLKKQAPIPALNACFSDIPIRDQRDTMERPFFSLSKTPRMTSIDYEIGNIYVRVSPSKDYGLATIWDADILIWAATQITEAMDRGERPSPVLVFHPYALLKAVRRGTSGKDYEQLRQSLRRLSSTYIETNIRRSPTKRKRIRGFHWLEDWEETISDEGVTETITLTLPRWLYAGIVQEGGVLTIHKDYFLLSSGLERWLYRVARKHAGMQEEGWSLTMRQLYDKSGSSDRFSNFSLAIRKLAKADALPDYTLSLSKDEKEGEVLHMLRRSLLDPSDPRFVVEGVSKPVAKGVKFED